MTPVKTRILAGGVHSTKQQVVRIDKATRLPERSAARRARGGGAARASAGRVDGVLVSDYGFGLLRRRRWCEAAVAFARRRRVPVTVDSRFDLLGFRGMTAVTPNEPEVEAALGVTIGHDRARLEAAGRALLRRLGVAGRARSRAGSDGMALFEPGRPPLHIPIYGSRPGGGRDRRGRHRDRHLHAGPGRGRLAGRGRAPRELRGRHRGDEARHRHRVRARSCGARSRRTSRSRERRGRPRQDRDARGGRARGSRRRAPRAASVALANGCFDLLHVGHVRYLEGARAEADVLVVGVNGDESVRRLKGEGRPILPARGSRAAGGGAAQRRPRGRVRGGRRQPRCCWRCGPTCTARAPTTPPETVPERDVVRSYGGRVAIVGDPKDHDTRTLIARLRAVKALVVRLSSIGDVVHTLPALAALRRARLRGRLAGGAGRAPAARGQPARRRRSRACRRRARSGSDPFRAGGARPARRALRRGARLPGALEVRRLGAPLRRAARDRLRRALAARAALAHPHQGGDVLPAGRSTSSTRTWRCCGPLGISAVGRREFPLPPTAHEAAAVETRLRKRGCGADRS